MTFKQLAEKEDNRASVLLGLFVPAIGWVAFNILGPALNQVDNMSNKKKSVIAAGALTSAALFGLCDSVQAATEV